VAKYYKKDVNQLNDGELVKMIERKKAAEARRKKEVEENAEIQ